MKKIDNFVSNCLFEIFLFQGKLLNFVMIGFHQITLSTFIRNFVLYCSVKKFEELELGFKYNRVIISNISLILKPERSFYDDLFKRYRLHKLTNKLKY